MWTLPGSSQKMEIETQLTAIKLINDFRVKELSRDKSASYSPTKTETKYVAIDLTSEKGADNGVGDVSSFKSGPKEEEEEVKH